MLKRRVLAELESDDVGLWSMVLSARQILGVGPGEAQGLVLSVLADLVGHSEAVLGFPTRDGTGFVAWATSPDVAVERIEREWSQLGRDPDLGEIAWLARSGRSEGSTGFNNPRSGASR